MLIQFIVISKNMQFSLQMTVTVADDLKNNEGKITKQITIVTWIYTMN